MDVPRILRPSRTLLLSFLLPVLGQAQSTHTFAVPSDAVCFVDVVSTAQNQPNTLSFTGYLPAGDSLAGRFPIDLTGGKAAGVFVPLEFATVPSTVVASTTAPSKASITCVKQTADFKFPLFLTPWYAMTIDIPLLSGYTQQSLEFPTQRLTFLKDSPGTIFQSTADPVTWKNTVLADYLGTDNTALLVAMTTQLDPTKTSPRDHILTKYVSRGATTTTTLDDFLPSVRENSGNGALMLSDTGLNRVNATQRFDTRYTTVPLQLQAEFADKRLYVPSVTVPPTGQDNVNGWQYALSLTNTSDTAATAYVRPFNAQGTALDFVVVSIPPGQTLTQQTQDLFKDVPNATTITNVEVQSDQALHGLALFKYNQHIVPIRAAGTLDLGANLVALRAQANPTNISSYAVANPGSRTETIQATAFKNDGSSIGQPATFTLSPHQNRTGTINDLLGQTNDALTGVSYVRFTATKPSNTTLDVQHPTGKITATLINIGYVDTTPTPGVITIPPLHIEGSVVDNTDAQRVNLVSDQYNPRVNVDQPKYNGGPHPITITLINDKPVTSVSYNPLQDGNLTKNYSATWNNKLPYRMLASTATTVDGPTYTNLPIRQAPTDWETSYNPRITINNADNTNTKLNTTMNILGELLPTSTDAILGPGTTLKTIQQNPIELANIFYQNRQAISEPSNADQSLGSWISFFQQLSDPKSPYCIRYSDFRDRSTNGFYFATVSDPDPITSVHAIPFAQTPSGEKAQDDVMGFFKIGQKWVDAPGTYKVGQ